MDNNQTPPQQPVQQPVSPATAPTSTPPSPSGKKPMSKTVIVLIILLVLICVAAAGAIAYNLFVKPNQTEPNDKRAAMEESLEKPTPTPFDQDGTPTPPPTSASVVQDNIEAAVSSKNYAALESYMTENVSFVLYASECCGFITAQEAVSQLSYLNTAVAPWDFDQTNPAIVQIKTQSAQEYSDLYIGLSSDDMMAAFGLDEENKISVIKVSASYKLLVAE